MRNEKPRGVPMDEWLLAIGLARDATGTVHRRPMCWRVAEAMGGEGPGMDNSLWSIGYDAARGDEPEHDDPDAYSASAGLAMALESDS
jgi:hypothetical protein